MSLKKQLTMRLILYSLLYLIFYPFHLLVTLLDGIMDELWIWLLLKIIEARKEQYEERD